MQMRKTVVFGWFMGLVKGVTFQLVGKEWGPASKGLIGNLAFPGDFEVASEMDGFQRWVENSTTAGPWAMGRERAGGRKNPQRSSAGLIPARPSAAPISKATEALPLASSLHPVPPWEPQDPSLSKAASLCETPRL